MRPVLRTLVLSLILVVCLAPPASAKTVLVKPDIGIRSSAVGPESVPALGSSPGGTNALPFGQFETGDICVAFSNPVGHAGVWDAARYAGSLNNYCFLTANVSPRNGVQTEQPIKYRNYDQAYGLWVPASTSYQRGKVRDFIAAQLGEPYDILSSKTDYARWYCSKLPYAAYSYRCGIALDANGGYWVAPADIYWDSDTALFAAAR